MKVLTTTSSFHGGHQPLRRVGGARSIAGAAVPGRVHEQPLTRRLFEEAGYNVRSAPLFNREVYSGTEIRKRIISGKEWEHLVPKGVAETIIEVGGDQRLRDLTREHSYEVTI